MTIDCNLTELIEKNVISFGAKLVVKQANIPVLQVQVYWPETCQNVSKERMYSVEGRENKKAGKNEKQRSEEKNRNCSAKKKKIGACAK